MTEIDPDHPDIVVFPPVIPILTLLIAGLLVVLLLMLVLLISWAVWGWPPFVVHGISWS